MSSSWRPLSKTRQLDGIGLNRLGTKLLHLNLYDDKQNLDEEMLLRAFTPHAEDFTDLSIPDEDDWLGSRNTKAQSFSTYARRASLRRPTPGKRDTILLLPLALETLSLENFPSVESLRGLVEAFFQLPVTLLPPLPINKLSGNVRINSSGQYHAGDILRELKKMKTKKVYNRCFTLMAFTMEDLYKNGFNYLFGLASGASGVGIFSFHRQDPANMACEFWNGTQERLPGDDEVLLRRAGATLCHELGHTIGLPHCVYYKCLMQGANSLEEAESRGHQLCPVCLRKLTWSVRCLPDTRYRGLLQYFQKHPHAFSASSEWLVHRMLRVGMNIVNDDDEKQKPLVTVAATSALSPPQNGQKRLKEVGGGKV